MKKVISLLLALIMTFAMVLPCFAAYDTGDYLSDIPVILISGDGDSIYDSDGNEVFRFSNLVKMITAVDGDAFKESLYNVIQPLMVEAVLKNNWQPFYDSLETEVGKLFKDCRLDENGNASNGSGISQERKDYMANAVANDPKKTKGGYGLYDYRFWYDWRLDPLENADTFNNYIKMVKKATGAPKVSIVTRCLGTSVVMAYIAKYGLDDIHGIGFDGTVANGAEILSEVISGKFRIDGEPVVRFLKDANAIHLVDISSFITSTADLVVSTGLVDGAITVTEALLYEKLVEGMTSALTLSTFFTWPSYWSAVTADDYEAALHHVFGPEGSEKRIKYAGLIKKIDNYNTVVRSNITKLYKSIAKNGVKVGTISKYGYQIIPLIESSDLVADQFASVTNSSFGATTSKVCDTLDKDYIEKRISEGKGKYISPDKQIDASTCIYPDYTWFTKGSSHSNWTKWEDNLLHEISTADVQLTINDFPEYSQYMVCNNDTGEMQIMTEENCMITSWDDTETKGLFKGLKKFIKASFNWAKEVWYLVKDAASSAISKYL